MLPRQPRLHRPGLFVTGTDTGVGKTVVACAIAWHLNRGQGPRDDGRRRVGVCKPISSGCRHDREGLVNEDAESLAHFADCREPLDVINPVRFKPAVAPAVASEKSGTSTDGHAIVRSLERLDANTDMVLVEGIGGLLVPLNHRDPQCTVLDLIVAIGYPVVLVTHAGLGTLNHTAMTVRLLRAAGCRVMGMVMNRFVTDSSGRAEAKVDASMCTNRMWLEKMNETRVLATVPLSDAIAVSPQHGRLPAAILEAVGVTYWPQILGSAKPGEPPCAVGQ